MAGEGKTGEVIAKFGAGGRESWRLKGRQGGGGRKSGIVASFGEVAEAVGHTPPSPFDSRP